MRIKNLFSIPDGEKVTEKALCRVLLSSVCGILLCMTCLVSTTWAWFIVSIENTDNVIQIATVSEKVTVINTHSGNVVEKPADGVYDLKSGEYRVSVLLTSDANGQDDLNKPKTPVYVLMSVTAAGAENDVAYYYFSFDGSAEKAEQTLEIYCESAALRFSVTWVEPVTATKIDNKAVIIGEKPVTMTEQTTTVPATKPEETTVPPTTETLTDPPATEVPTVPPTTESPADSAETTAPAAGETTALPATEPEETNTGSAAEPPAAPTESE